IMYLVYHEHSESPFNPDGTIRTPPFTLHDCGTWSIDTARSTGVFAGATGSGGITAFVPVRPDFSAPGFADYIGTMTLADGATSPARPAPVNCNGAMTGAIISSLNVPKGVSCSLEAASVNGNLSVAKGGSLAMTNSVVGGNADCLSCAGVNMSNSTVLGNFSELSSPAGGSFTSNF